MFRFQKLSLTVVFASVLAACGGADSNKDEITSSSNSNPISSTSSLQSSSTASSQSVVEQPQEFEFDPVVALAINAGGEEITGTDGIRYAADAYFSEGNTYSTEGAIDLTDNDALYQSERWNAGNLLYEIPMANGIYDITLKFAEVFHDTAGARAFDIALEGTAVTTGLDLVAQVGPLAAHDIQYHGVEVSDGTLTIELTGTLDNPKISAIVVYREPNGGDIYRQQCLGCHGNEKGEAAITGGALTASECRACSSLDNLASFIDIAMPATKASWCKGQCSIDVANYILDNFAGFNGIPEEAPVEQVPLAGDIAACEQGEDAAFGGLRRLTRVEYQNLVSQLFNDTNDYTGNFGKDGKLGNFNINVEVPISGLQTDQYMEVGATVAQSAAANLNRWAPCTSEDVNCVNDIIDNVVSRAYRRPLTSDDRARLLAIFQDSAGGFETALATMLQAVLSSPYFLYHLEFGTDQHLPSGVVPLSSHEIAARLSFFLWRSAPDAALLSAAQANQLQTPAQIESQARRMLQDPRAKVAVGRFHLEWLKLAYPEAGAANEAEAIAAIEDTVRTVTELTYADNGDFKDLFSVSYGFLNDVTKDLYSVTGSATALGSNGFDKYALAPIQRGGILSRAGFLSFNTPPSGRGKFVREQLLCGVIPLPPADFIPEAPEGDPNSPPRERWAEHVTNPACGGCHRLMDPLGFGFDHYDDHGQWRSMVGTWPVDATGEIVETTDIDGLFDGHVELQQILSTSVDTQACYAVQWFRFAIGRQPGLKDSCALAEINQIASNENYNIREVMIAITQSDAFRFRRAEPAQ
ncbi:malectin domain-containing carbohydrate-binding protein [Marinagarivorans cellulosilyticus]|uniref:Cytochrome c domain-containing protein n=1 Tax=Marinagarivorans cellulosilyticus TaxID=2721545 RepID=A0AAN2BLI7_9GAMM|nr:malectin domain-containing carbohydrate-binding protein [Marinagarivorans cellulosilyticus]BCD99183.1 hypothetical protein MARGE09_P3384 [Marinagarivorans cellulosilyticus]